MVIDFRHYYVRSLHVYVCVGVGQLGLGRRVGLEFPTYHKRNQVDPERNDTEQRDSWGFGSAPNRNQVKHFRLFAGEVACGEGVFYVH